MVGITINLCRPVHVTKEEFPLWWSSFLEGYFLLNLILITRIILILPVSFPCHYTCMVNPIGCCGLIIDCQSIADVSILDSMIMFTHVILYTIAGQNFSNPSYVHVHVLVPYLFQWNIWSNLRDSRILITFIHGAIDDLYQKIMCFQNQNCFIFIHSIRLSMVYNILALHICRNINFCQGGKSRQSSTGDQKFMG